MVSGPLGGKGEFMANMRKCECRKAVEISVARKAKLAKGNENKWHTGDGTGSSPAVPECGIAALGTQ